jgi:hypothetical protein
MIVPLLFLAAQALPAPDAVQWELLAETSSGGRLLIDPASISRNGDVVQFTSRLDGRPLQPPGTTMMILRAAMDCRRHMLAMLAADAYGEDGRLLRSRRSQPSEITYEPIGGNNGFFLFEPRVCPGPAALPTLPAPDAVQWELVDVPREGRLLIDPASIAREGDVVRFTGRFDGRPGRAPSTNVAIVRIAIDCRRHTFTILALDRYGESGARTFSSRVRPQNGEEPIRPNGLGLYEPRVCRTPGR